jgi:phosphoglycolate phosphatase
LKYQLAIFDSDGTLADTLPWMRGVFNELARIHGFREVASDEYEHFRDLHGRELLKALNLPLWKLPRVIGDMRKRMAQRAEPFALFPGIDEMLKGLSAAGVKLAIVSSNSRENVERILGSENARLIDYYGCGASVFGKAAKIQGVLRRARIPRERAIYIGDEIRDAVACQKVGIPFGAVTWGQHTTAALAAQSPFCLFRSPQEIIFECS